MAQTPVSLAGSEPVEASVSGVRHVIGLPNVKQWTAGKLVAGPDGIRFESEGAQVFVKSAHLLRLSTGDERQMKGGTLGRFVRTGVPGAGGVAIAFASVSQAFSVIPFAVGLVASAATQGSLDIFTIEFLDPADGYHAAIFTMPRHAAEVFQKNFPAVQETVRGGTVEGACEVASALPSVSLLPVRSEDSDVPAEYRALIYERLFSRLSEPQGAIASLSLRRRRRLLRGLEAGGYREYVS